MDTDELRAIAEAAPPAPWDWQPADDNLGNAVLYGPDGDSFAFLEYNPGNDYNMEAAAQFVATFNPARALAACRLADALEALGDYPQSPEAIAEGRAALAAWRAL